MKKILLSALLALAPLTGSAQDYPSKPIKLIVPFPAGGGTDIIGRVLGQKLSEQLKQPIIIENKPGAAGSIGVDVVAKSPADGYTLVLGQTSNIAINPSLYKNLSYDPLKDLSPVINVAEAPLVLVVGASSPFKNFDDIKKAAIAKPNEITFGSPGSGTVAHLTGELLQAKANIKFNHIPYKGSAQALTDLMGGRLDVYMSSIPTALAQIKGGKLRAIAVTAANKTDVMPDIPTFKELGVKDLVTNSWFGIFVPAKTPQAIIERLSKEINLAIQSDSVKEKIAFEGGRPVGGTIKQFDDLIKSEIPLWAEVVKSSGATVD